MSRSVEAVGGESPPVYVFGRPSSGSCDGRRGMRSIGSTIPRAAGGDAAIITRNRRMLDILCEVRHAAPLPLPVLIEGESGVGKELVARLIHASSGGGRRPFVPVNVAALPHELFESILFGHARGAFTGASTRRGGLIEAAGGGTLFLDEIGEIGPALQAKLLRLLDCAEYIPLGESAVRFNRSRIVASTNRDLTAAVEAGDFRADLYHRLRVLSFRIPPLRERRDDVPPLVDHFMRLCTAQYRLGPFSISDAAMSLLIAYDWPGNVRELRNEVMRAAVRKRRGTVRVCHLSARAAGWIGTRAESSAGTLAERLASIERREIVKALKGADGNVTRAAAALGVKRTTLLYRMRRFGIE